MALSHCNIVIASNREEYSTINFVRVSVTISHNQILEILETLINK